MILSPPPLMVAVAVVAEREGNKWFISRSGVKV